MAGIDLSSFIQRDILSGGEAAKKMEEGYAAGAKASKDELAISQDDPRVSKEESFESFLDKKNKDVTYSIIEAIYDKKNIPANKRDNLRGNHYSQIEGVLREQHDSVYDAPLPRSNREESYYDEKIRLAETIYQYAVANGVNTPATEQIEAEINLHYMNKSIIYSKPQTNANDIMLLLAIPLSFILALIIWKLFNQKPGKKKGYAKSIELFKTPKL